MISDGPFTALGLGLLMVKGAGNSYFIFHGFCEDEIRKNQMLYKIYKIGFHHDYFVRGGLLRVNYEKSCLSGQLMPTCSFLELSQ